MCHVVVARNGGHVNVLVRSMEGQNVRVPTCRLSTATPTSAQVCRTMLTAFKFIFTLVVAQLPHDVSQYLPKLLIFWFFFFLSETARSDITNANREEENRHF